ncbi:fibronectin type III domain-containing protein [Streptomyces yaanensis]|uniref:Fibronectin type III domain-containing protein n=1 Tax=Streptomyces yaanensis TaxID=1142239 RepID=A0ABV7SCX2_9ACTN|nr:PA14 domain-containing protein [Streptomyces sp. CGMCC 4.7035]WNB96762.1 PA14 domain-containing protein [Streptomyces sp. CGMCC 4.7035]
MTTVTPVRRHHFGPTLAATLAVTTAGTLLAAAPAAEAAVSCASPVHKRQFFANTTFSGTPKKTDCDSKIAENWGTGAPASGLPSNNFGVRWSVTRDFGSGGPFAFSAAAQDGIRVYLDGTRKVDLWKNVSSTVKKTVNVTIPSGKHTLRIDYVNWTGTANVAFGYAPRTSATVDKVKPLAPTGISVAYDKTTGKAKLTWSKNKEMDLAGYRVYRRLQSTDAWKRLTTTTAASYTDTPPATGDTYHYEVRAHDKAGNESIGSTDRSVTTADRTPPPVPSGVTATDGQAGVTVTWNAVPGAAEYLVHRRRDDDGGDNPVVQVARVTTTFWLDTAVEERRAYTYWVTAVDSVGNKSAKSAYDRIERGDYAPSAPTGLTATAAAGSGITLTWKAPTTPVARDLGHFRIYRNGRFIDEVRATQTSYSDTGVRQSTSYTYTVTAVDTQAQESVASAPVTCTAPGTGLAPGAVTGLRGAMNGTDIELAWDRNPEEDVDHYDVYRGELVDGDWRYGRWGQVWQTYEDEPRLFFADEIDSPQGATVRWAVVAVDTYGNSRFTSGEDYSYVTVTEPESAE